MICLSVLSLNRVSLLTSSSPNLYRYQNYIGSRILYPGHSEEQIKSVLQSEQGESENVTFSPTSYRLLESRKESFQCLSTLLFPLFSSLVFSSPFPFLLLNFSPRTENLTLTVTLNLPSVKIRIQALATRRVETLLSSHPLPKNPTEAKKLSNYALRKRAELELQLTDVARAMIEKSAARLDSLNFLKIFAVTVNNLLARMYHLGIHLNVHQVLEVRRVAAYAAERKQSIIFLPCHKRLVREMKRPGLNDWERFRY